jgi:hypothetical protein
MDGRIHPLQGDQRDSIDLFESTRLPLGPPLLAAVMTGGHTANYHSGSRSWLRLDALVPALIVEEMDDASETGNFVLSDVVLSGDSASPQDHNSERRRG